MSYETSLNAAAYVKMTWRRRIKTKEKRNAASVMKCSREVCNVAEYRQ